MSNLSPMVANIKNNARMLDEKRRMGCLLWLRAHTGQDDLSTAERLDGGQRMLRRLKAWFESLPVGQAACEYQAILDEISWWRSLSEKDFALFLEEYRSYRI